MKLDWRDMPIGGGPAISTSLTADETATLAALGKGRRVLEIGTAYGYSTVVLAQVAQDVVAVDPHVWLGSYDALMGNLEAYQVANRVDVRRAGAETVLPELATGRRRFGLIWIDADHREFAVRRDVSLSLPLLGRTGVLAVHDYGEETCTDVRLVLDGMLGEPHELVDTLAIYRGLGSA